MDSKKYREPKSVNNDYCKSSRVVDRPKDRNEEAHQLTASYFSEPLDGSITFESANLSTLKPSLPYAVTNSSSSLSALSRLLICCKLAFPSVTLIWDCSRFAHQSASSPRVTISQLGSERND